MLKNNSYICGQAEAALDVVPGLMSHDYVLGRLDTKKGKKSSGAITANRQRVDKKDVVATAAGIAAIRSHIKSVKTS